MTCAPLVLRVCRHKKRKRGGERSRQRKHAEAARAARAAREDAGDAAEAEHGAPGLFAFINGALGGCLARAELLMVSVPRPWHAWEACGLFHVGRHPARVCVRHVSWHGLRLC